MHTRSTRRPLIVATLVTLGLALGGLAEAKGRAPQKAKEQPQGVVNINTATPEQLQLLPGIGPSKAGAIVKYRAKRKFKATHELIRIRGIGHKTFRKLRVYLAVKGQTTLSEKVRRAR